MPDLDFSRLDTMSEAEEEQFMEAFTLALASDDGEEAKRRLAAGLSIYYGDTRFKDAVVKEYPDGHRQLVTFEGDTEVFIRDLP